MDDYKNVIVAIDLDGGAEEVLQRARALFGQTDTKITILCAVPVITALYGGPVTGTYYGTGASVFDENQVRDATLPHMQALAEAAHLSEPELVVDFGRPVDVILDQAKDRSADLIVVGSHGRHGLAILLGSTANGVLHRAKTDVLAVRLSK